MPTFNGPAPIGAGPDNASRVCTGAAIIGAVALRAAAARDSGLNGRVLVPLTRGHAGGAALQFEVELAHFDQLDQFRHRGAGSSEDTNNWMRKFSAILTAPPRVEILRAEELNAT